MWTGFNGNGLMGALLRFCTIALLCNISAQAAEDPYIYLCTHKDGRKEISDSDKDGSCKKLELPKTSDVEKMVEIPKFSDEEAYSYAKKSLQRRLIDPESVRYRDLRISKRRDYVCGEFNAKNRHGGYEGFSQFAVRLEKGKYSSRVWEYSYYCDAQ